MVQRRDFRLAHELQLRIGRPQPDRGRVGAVVRREWVARAIRRDQGGDVTELGVDHRRLDGRLTELVPSELDDEGEDQEE